MKMKIPEWVDIESMKLNAILWIVIIAMYLLIILID